MSFLMIFAFVLYAWSTRQVGVVVLIFALQAVIYTELVHVHISEARERSMTGFSSLYFYWFGVAAFFFYSRIILPYVSSALTGEPVPRGGRGLSLNPSTVPPRLEGTKWRALAFWVTRWLVEKHVPISFALYCVGLVLFVVSLRRRRNFRYQFSQFAYCHIALLVVVGQSTLLVANAFSGLLWVLLPTGMVIANDCFAYLAGERLFAGLFFAAPLFPKTSEPPPPLHATTTHTRARAPLRHLPPTHTHPTRRILWAHPPHPPLPQKNCGGLPGWGSGHPGLLPALHLVGADGGGAGVEVPHGVPRAAGPGPEH
jgi:CDP-diglyceride synthetase